MNSMAAAWLYGHITPDEISDWLRHQTFAGDVGKWQAIPPAEGGAFNFLIPYMDEIRQRRHLCGRHAIFLCDPAFTQSGYIQRSYRELRNKETSLSFPWTYLWMTNEDGGDETMRLAAEWKGGWFSRDEIRESFHHVPLSGHEKMARRGRIATACAGRP